MPGDSTPHVRKQAPLRVLLADDHQAMRAALRRLLTRTGAFVVVGEVSDGDALVSAFEEHTPDVTLVDVRMPPTSGLDSARQLLAAHPEATVVFLSGDDPPEAVVVAERMGAAGYLHKAVSAPQLCAALREAATRRAGQFVRASPLPWSRRDAEARNRAAGR